MREKILNSIKTLYQDSKVAVMLCDKDYNILWSNPNSIIAGMTSEEIKSFNFFTEKDTSIIKHFQYNKLNLTARGITINNNGLVEGYLFKIITSAEASIFMYNADLSNRHLALYANIREQVAGIVGIIGMLYQKAENDERYEDIKLYKTQLNCCYKVLSATINSTEFSRYSLKDFREKTFDVSSNIIKILDTIKAPLKKNNVILEYDEIDEEVWTKADGNRFLCAFMNILVNAAQYNISEDKRIKVSLKNKEQYAILSVADNGTGISPKQMMKINAYNDHYVPYPQANEQKDKFDFGSGFRVIYAFCEAFNCNLIISTKENEGTTVSMRIPIVEEAESDLNERLDDILSNRFSNLYVILSKIYPISII